MTDQHQPFDDDPELYDDGSRAGEGGSTHGQDEADDRETLLDAPKSPRHSDPDAPRTDHSREDTQPQDDDL